MASACTTSPAFSYGDGVSDDDFEPRRRSVTPRARRVVASSGEATSVPQEQVVTQVVTQVDVVPGVAPEAPAAVDQEEFFSLKRAYKTLLDEHCTMGSYFTNQLKAQREQMEEQRGQLRRLEQKFRIMERKFRRVQDAQEEACELLDLAQRALKRQRE